MPKQTTYETLSPEDVGDDFAVIVRIKPDLPQEEMQKAQLIAAFRAPGTDGRPFMSDRELRTLWGVENPETSEREVDAQLLLNDSPDVKKLIIAARVQRWMDANPEIVKLAEKQMGAPIPQEQVMAMMQLLMKQAQGAQGLPQLLAQADTLAAGGQPMGAPAQGPVGMDPAALPSQMQIGADPGAQNQADPALLAASQAQRGRAQQPY
jgi:hypothetical protein